MKIYDPFTDSILQHIKRSRLALTALLGLFLVYTVATFAPFLANDKPLMTYSTNPDAYEDAYWAWKDSLDLLLQLNDNEREKIQSHLRSSFLRSLKWVNEHGSQVSNFRRELKRKHPRIDFLKKRSGVILELLSPEKVKYKKRFMLPVLHSLSKTEVFFILSYFFILFRLTYFIQRKFFSTRMLLVAVSLILVLTLLHPRPVFNPGNYKDRLVHLNSGEWMVFPPVPFGFNENTLSAQGVPPSWMGNDPGSFLNRHLLGTDTNGRDVLSRMVWGSRVSMSVGIVSVGIYATIGILIGLLAGFLRGKIDLLVSRLIEVMICFPSFFLILTVMVYLHPSILNIMVVIGLTAWPGIARLMRAEALKLSSQDFVSSARALGASTRRILFKHILVNGMAPVLVAATFGMADAILIEAALSFLGIGVPQPTASWGDLLNNARNNIQGLWWLTLFPGLILFLTVTAYNTVGETLRDALDPRLKK